MKRRPNTNAVYITENVVSTLQLVWDTYNNAPRRTKQDIELSQRVRLALSDATDLLGLLVRGKYTVE